MTDLVLYENGATLTQAEEEELWERVATAYLRLQEERKGRKVKVDEALGVVLAEHDYPEVAARAAVVGRGFDEYLASRRKDNLIRSLVPSIYAAEYGGRLGGMAAEELMTRLEQDPAGMDTKDLLAIVKTGYELAAKADRATEEVTGTTDVKVNLDLRGLLVGLPPDMAADYMAEIGRRMIAGEK